ncbi:MAG: DmsC/YnfH family molybdoenzyme membrane anchor subunit [Melioribacteraceae bacterium]|nr:DmsC/YnfH family molybdoenzyme membrane anchor subunit [Melioribacteraceae bacterium]
MHFAECPLILFTIMVQMAVGAFLFLGVIHHLSLVKLNDEIFTVISKPILNVTGFILVLAVIVAGFHLGNPINAFNALNNLGTSWLSREILSLILFLLSGGFFLLIYIRQKLNRKLVFSLALITVALGYIAIASMAMVYMLETVPVWNNLFTPLAFVFTSLILGSGAILHALNIIINKKKYSLLLNEFSIQKLTDPFKIISLFILGLLFFQVIIMFSQLIYLGSGDETLRSSFGILIEKNILLIILRLLLLLSAFLWLISLLVKYNRTRDLLLKRKYYALYFGILLLEELIGRYLFYAMYFRIGV